MIDRTLSRIVTLPPAAPGPFGTGHTAILVVRPEAWATNDPFILLADDRIDGHAQAAPHPHAGFETVTFVVDGTFTSEGGTTGPLGPGDLEWTTAGSGIIHGSEAPFQGKMRVLQLWVTLPKADRWTAPDHQIVRRDEALVRSEPGATVRLYSGASGALRSGTRNRVPLTVAEVRVEPGAAVVQEVPLSHNGFLYVLDGEGRIGADEKPLGVGQIGWLDAEAAGDGDGRLRIANHGDVPLRVLVYTGQRQGVPIVSYGPFIGDTRADITRSMERYRAGTFQRY